MGALVVASGVSVDEYLSNPAYQHCEYANGNVVTPNELREQRLNIPVRAGGEIISYLESRLKGLARVAMTGCSGPEPSLERAPDLAVEIRLPESTIASVFRNMERHLANGAKLGWVILPEEESVIVLSRTASFLARTMGDTLEGGEIIPGLSIPVADLFV